MIWHQLNQRLPLYRRLMTADGMGGGASTFTLVGYEWVLLSLPAGGEKVIGLQAAAELTPQVYLSPYSQVQRGDELRDGTTVYRVISIAEPSTPDTYLVANCEMFQREVIDGA